MEKRILLETSMDINSQHGEKIIVLSMYDRGADWSLYTRSSDTMVYVTPFTTQDGTVEWRVLSTISTDYPFDEKEYSVRFPDTWLGLKKKEFAKASGIPEALYCAKSGTVAGFKTKNAAIRAAQIIISNIGERVYA